MVTQRHNEIHDALKDLVAMGFKEVVREPIVKEADDSVDSPALIADLSTQDVWQPQTVALLDVHVVDTDAQSYTNRCVITPWDGLRCDYNLLYCVLPIYASMVPGLNGDLLQY